MSYISLTCCSALYAHKFNTLFYHDINNAEQFGFARGQVTPFNIRTPDGETLYAWHILPIDVYARHEKALRDANRPNGLVEDVETSSTFKLLAGTSDARLVISCKSIISLTNHYDEQLLTRQRSPRQRRPHSSRLEDRHIPLLSLPTEHSCPYR